jgi:hypothetical protein
MEIIDKINEELYCILYVDASEPLAAAYIDDFCQGKKDGINSYDDVMYSIVSSNDEKNNVKKMDLVDGFLFYSSYVEIISFKNIDKTVFVEHVERLIKFLCSKGVRVVPSCDFEDELNDEKLSK